MSQDQEFYIKNLITEEDIQTEDGKAILPLFTCSQYKIKAYFKNSNYAKNKYRKSVRWNFGDGTITEGSSAEHYYTIPGKYKITCTFYDIDRKPHESQKSIEVIVKEIIPINLEIIENKVNDSVTRSKISKLLTLQSTLSSNISVIPPIIIKRVNDDKEQKSYFDIRNDKYYHLERYHTFLKEAVDYTYKKDIKDKVTLTPTKYYVPKYSPLYIKFNSVDSKIVPELYVYIENEKYTLPTKYKLYNPEASVLINHASLNDDYYAEVELHKIGYMSELPEDSEHCGWIGLENIWYKDDYIGENKLYFSYDMSYAKFNNDLLNSHAINIPPLGIKINVIDNEEEAVYALTGTGILKDFDKADESIIIEKHLLHNFYTDYTTEAYVAKYIKNESYDDTESWSIYKSDITIPELNGTKCTIKKLEDNTKYINHYELTPVAQGFQLILDKKVYTNDKLSSLGGIVLPEKNYTYISFENMLNAYMQHPMYEDKDFIRQFFRQIFETDYLFEDINNKGFNFFDDIVNHKTCYIGNLKSTLELFGNDVKDYNVSGFDKINELKELIRILSMHYSELFGQYEVIEEDISIKNGMKGACVGDRILPSDIIVCDIKFIIIGLIRNNKFYPIKNYTNKLILVDDFTEKSKLVSFDTIETHTYYENHKELETLYDAKYYYSLNDYSYNWNWNLKLPKDLIHQSNKANIIDTYYSLYLYNPSKSIKDRKYNYLNKDTMPYSDFPNATYITPEEWNQDFGYTYDCLMKVLLYKLGLNK